MKSNIIFSLFGEYQRFNTKNSDLYIKLIEFFRQKGYTPSTTNELTVQPNGQVNAYAMPLFSNNSSIVAIASKQITFQKNNIDDSVDVLSIYNITKYDFCDILKDFVSNMEIESSRIGLNCNMQYDLVDKTIPTQFKLIKSEKENIKISTVQNVMRQGLLEENVNVVVTKSIDTMNNLKSFALDINSLAENHVLRFKKDNISTLFEEYLKLASKITMEAIYDDYNRSVTDNNSNNQ